MLKILRHLYDISVFRPINLKYLHDGNATMAALFHRTAATLYLIYATWGVATLFTRILYVPMAEFPVEIIFSSLIVPCAILSCVGATFFPRTGRLELFSASALLSLIVIYLVLMLIVGLQGRPDVLTNFIINTAHVVVPAARVMFVYKTLVWNAKTTGGGQRA